MHVEKNSEREKTTTGKYHHGATETIHVYSKHEIRKHKEAHIHILSICAASIANNFVNHPGNCSVLFIFWLIILGIAACVLCITACVLISQYVPCANIRIRFKCTNNPFDSTVFTVIPFYIFFHHKHILFFNFFCEKFLFLLFLCRFY